MSEWRFLLDENIDPKTANYLEKESVHTEHVRDALGQGADDEADRHPSRRVRYGVYSPYTSLSDSQREQLSVGVYRPPCGYTSPLYLFLRRQKRLSVRFARAQ